MYIHNFKKIFFWKSKLKRTIDPFSRWPQELCQNQEAGASSRSPLCIQGPKRLGHLPMLSHAIGRELDWKGSNWDRTSKSTDARIAGGCFTCYGIMLVPKDLLLLKNVLIWKTALRAGGELPFIGSLATNVHRVGLGQSQDPEVPFSFPMWLAVALYLPKGLLWTFLAPLEIPKHPR